MFFNFINFIFSFVTVWYFFIYYSKMLITTSFLIWIKCWFSVLINHFLINYHSNVCLLLIFIVTINSFVLANCLCLFSNLFLHKYNLQIFSCYKWNDHPILQLMKVIFISLYLKFCFITINHKFYFLYVELDSNFKLVIVLKLYYFICNSKFLISDFSIIFHFLIWHSISTEYFVFIFYFPNHERHFILFFIWNFAS